MRVVVHNSDGVNPYAVEVAGLLKRGGAQSTIVDARNSTHEPLAGVRWRRLLPETFGRRSPASQAVALAAGLGATLWSSVVRRHVVLVAFTRFPIEDLLLACLARFRRPVVVVVHNPVPREVESRRAKRCRLRLLEVCDAVVVHSDRLRDSVDPHGRDKVQVCPHPPYVDTVADAAPGLELDPGLRWIAFVGALRWDKGVDILLDVLAGVPVERRRRMGVVVCGRGSLPPGTWQQLVELGYAVRDLTSPNPVPRELLLDVLRCRPLVLAPYVAATQSGSVILALSLGCEVLSFDAGGVPDVLDDAGLVPNGDVAAMSAALAEGRGGGARVALPLWHAAAVASWSRVVQAAAGAGRERRSSDGDVRALAVHEDAEDVPPVALSG